MNSNIHPIALMIGLVSILANCDAPADLPLDKVCFCTKADLNSGIPSSRCGKLLLYDPSANYSIDEIDGGRKRGPVILPAQDYVECEDKKPPSTQQYTVPGPPKGESPASPSAGPHSERFGIRGSSTIGEELIAKLVAGYAEQIGWIPDAGKCSVDKSKIGRMTLHTNPGAKQKRLEIDCQATGSDEGIPALTHEEADIAMLSRDIRPDEVKAMREQGYPGVTTALHEHILGLDGVVVVVPDDRQRPLALAPREIVRRFGVTEGDTRQRYNLYLRDKKSGTRGIFIDRFFNPGNLPPCDAPGARPGDPCFDRNSALPACDAPGVHCFDHNSALLDALARDPRGIGFVSFGFFDRHIDQWPAISAVAITGECGITQNPTAFDIKTEDYILTRRLSLFTGKVHSLHVPNFVLFSLSAKGQGVLPEVGFVNQLVDANPAETLGERVRRYMDHVPQEADLDYDSHQMQSLLRKAERGKRLSITFRFRFNSSNLDAKATQDIHRLAEYLTEHRDGRILLAGFADSDGGKTANVELSKRRAEAVRQSLMAVGIAERRLEATGYGELLPVACNAWGPGKEKNRRVEAWLVPE